MNKIKNAEYLTFPDLSVTKKILFPLSFPEILPESDNAVYGIVSGNLHSKIHMKQIFFLYIIS